MKCKISFKLDSQMISLIFKLGIEGDLTSYLYDVLPLGPPFINKKKREDGGPRKDSSKDKKFHIHFPYSLILSLFFIQDQPIE